MNVYIIVFTIFLLFSVSLVNSLPQEQINTINNLSSQLNISNETLISLFTFLEVNKTDIDTKLNALTHNQELLNSSVNLQMINTLNDWKNQTIDSAFLNITKYNEEGIQNAIESNMLNFTDTVNERLTALNHNMVKEEYINSTYANFTWFVMAQNQQYKIDVENNTRNLFVFNIIALLGIGLFLYRYITQRFENMKDSPYIKGIVEKIITPADSITFDEYKRKEKKLLTLRNYLLKKHKGLPTSLVQKLYKMITYRQLENEHEVDEAVMKLNEDYKNINEMNERDAVRKPTHQSRNQEMQNEIQRIKQEKEEVIKQRQKETSNWKKKAKPKKTKDNEEYNNK